MATVTVTDTKKNTKDKDKEFKSAVEDADLDKVLNNVKKIDNVCSFIKCKTKVQDYSIHCKFCNNHFCLSHGLPEIHGCGEAVRREERRKFEHPDTSKLSKDQHTKAKLKFDMKMKQMQNSRKKTSKK